MLREFRDFIEKGNVLDLAVAFIMGVAFAAVVTSFVDDIVMPILGLFTGGISFDNLFIALDGNSYETLQAAMDAGAATLRYGLFINAIINFLVIAFIIFLIVRSINNMKKPEAAPPPPEPTSEEKLLREIRDLLARRA